MAQEIELKFIVQPQSGDALCAFLNTLPGQHSEPRKLSNIYYETQDNYLRRHDAGLRIRGVDGRYEMTIKTAGHVVGGLHQRPEYNVALDAPVLALDKFPAEIWPQGCDVAELEKALHPLFSTDFLREKWVVTHGDSEVEIAFDQGEVKAGEFSEVIHELELELIKGNTEDVLSLAGVLASRPGVRQGLLSKAARGYHLAKGNPERPHQALPIMQLPLKSSVEKGLETALGIALNHWLYHEELWVRGDQKAKNEIIESIGLIRAALVLFGGIIPRKASTHLRDMLTHTESDLALDVSAESVVWETRFTQTKLALTQWLVTRGWRPFLDEKALRSLDEGFKRFADINLSRHSAELKRTFTHVTGDSLRDQLPRLSREVHILRLLSGFYDQTQASHWLDNWQELCLAIRQGSRHEADHFRHEALAQAPFWLHSGQSGKH
ncbi:inorganic triphosphatase [Mangrovibacter phragmitis]|uniref:CYTH domain-containing protein n=1 Tax=Mangrovibacter phragmitis TaxID=1691903 RepID=UPI00336AA90E